MFFFIQACREIPGEDFLTCKQGSSLNRINATTPDAPVYWINVKTLFLLKNELSKTQMSQERFAAYFAFLLCCRDKVYQLNSVVQFIKANDNQIS